MRKSVFGHTEPDLSDGRSVFFWPEGPAPSVRVLCVNTRRFFGQAEPIPTGSFRLRAARVRREKDLCEQEKIRYTE
jgi:hypothetical protein